MADLRTPDDGGWAYARQRRRRARRFMQALTLACALAGAGIGAAQLSSGGLHAFLERPPGVGATPPTPSAATQVALTATNPATRRPR